MHQLLSAEKSGMIQIVRLININYRQVFYVEILHGVKIEIQKFQNLTWLCTNFMLEDLQWVIKQQER